MAYSSQKNINYTERNKMICENIRNNVQIVDYAASLGYTLIKKGNYFTTKEHDSLMINAERNRYKRYSIDDGKWKSVIDFAQEYENLSFGDAINKLKSFANIKDDYLIQTPIRMSPKREEYIKKDLQLPLKQLECKNVFAYLTKTRHINPSVVNELISRGYIYQTGVISKENDMGTKDVDKYKHSKITNCVFVGKDKLGKENFAMYRSDMPDTHFRGNAVGSDYNHGIFIDNNASTLVVNEAIIDSMSVMSILQDSGRNINNYNYLSICSTSNWQAAINQLKENPNIKKVIIGFDADEAGFKALNKLQNGIDNEFGKDIDVISYLPENCTDWNEQLCYNRENNIDIHQYNKEQTFYRSLQMEQDLEKEFELSR